MPQRLLLLLLLCTDAAFIAMHLAVRLLPQFDGPLYLLGTDRGYAEAFQYVKLYWIAILFALHFLQRRRILFLAWSAVFSYLLLDDSLRFHERLGAQFARATGLAPVLGADPAHVGELLVSVLLGILLLAVVLPAWFLGSAEARQSSKPVLGLLALLALLGVGVDALRAWVPAQSLRLPFELIEDGGEMVVVSVILCAVFKISAPLCKSASPRPIAADGESAASHSGTHSA